MQYWPSPSIFGSNGSLMLVIYLRREICQGFLYKFLIASLKMGVLTNSLQWYASSKSNCNLLFLKTCHFGQAHKLSNRLFTLSSRPLLISWRVTRSRVIVSMFFRRLGLMDNGVPILHTILVSGKGQPKNTHRLPETVLYTDQAQNNTHLLLQLETG